MSELLTIDTGAGIIKEEVLDPLPLYDDSLPMLGQIIPEYNTKILPNNYMTTLVKRLKMTMKQFAGIGLSANQCGVFERVFIIGTEHFQIACINPRVICSSEEQDKSPEGCLSYPGLFLKIERPEWVEVEFTTETGEVKQMRFEGITARAFMHELDHMNGVRFVEHVGPVALQMAKKKQKKITRMVKKQFKINSLLEL